MTACRRLLTHASFFAALAGCAAAETDAGLSSSAATAADQDALLDVNDVSILFPVLPKPFPDIRLDERVDDVGGTLFSQKQFDDLVAFARSREINFVSFRGSDAIDSWRIVAMRFDPCSLGVKSTGPKGIDGDRSKCTVQVRLVAQPFIPEGSPDEVAGDARDISAHFVYELGPLAQANLAGIRKDLVAIKDASTRASAKTAGAFLGVHPGLAKRDEAVGEAVRTFITKYVAKATGARVAYVGTGNFSDGNWIMTGGSLEGAGPLKDRKFVRVDRGPMHGLVNMPARTPSEAVQPDISTPLRPLPVNRDASAERLLDVPIGPEDAAALPQRKKDEIASLAFSLEDPAKHNFFTTNCFSCHISTPRSQVAAIKSTAARVRVPAGISGYLTTSTIQRSHYNFHAFSWFKGKPSVSMRTVNESVEVVELLNEKLEKEGFAGPGLDCSHVDDAVWDCLAHTDQAGAAACLRECRPFPRR